MRVIYLGRFTDTPPDDEGAVAHALRELGHEVECVHERCAYKLPRLRADLLLCNKWFDPGTLKRVPYPKVFYYWDLVSYPDPSLARRNAARLRWMAETIPFVDLGFLSDGDFVARDVSGKLHFLPQGADGRVAGAGTYRGKAGLTRSDSHVPVLFTGIRDGGRGRAGWVDEMTAVHGDNFFHAEGVYGRELADLIAGTDVVVAPDHPVTDRYCSNRVWVTLGYGGFLLHPYSAFLADCYRDREEIVFYRSRDELHSLICHYRARPEERRRIAEAGLRRTLAEHLYRHRAEKLMRTVQERLM